MFNRPGHGELGRGGGAEGFEQGVNGEDIMAHDILTEEHASENPHDEQADGHQPSHRLTAKAATDGKDKGRNDIEIRKDEISDPFEIMTIDCRSTGFRGDPWHERAKVHSGNKTGPDKNGDEPADEEARETEDEAIRSGGQDEFFILRVTIEAGGIAQNPGDREDAEEAQDDGPGRNGIGSIDPLEAITCESGLISITEGDREIDQSAEDDKGAAALDAPFVAELSEPGCHEFKVVTR